MTRMSRRPPSVLAPAARRLRAASSIVALLATLAACGGDGGTGAAPQPLDTVAPGVPQSVTAVAQSASTVQLTWDASTDAGTGVAGYRVYRDGGAAPVATVSDGTTHLDSGLTPATVYSYTVTAFDRASPANESAPSAAATAATLPQPARIALATQRAYANLPAFQSPVLALQAPGDGSTWYVVEQAGRVHAFADDAGVAATRLFVDLSARVRAGGETGLLGMAFHPAYPATPRVYLSYTADVAGQLVSRIVVLESLDGGATLDPASETLLLAVAQPASNHNGGHLAFGPHDGLLHVALGDGGGAGDPWGAFGNGQDLTTVLGKILRLDVDGSTSPSVPYRIPAANPFAANEPCPQGVGVQPCPEVLAYGFRNPWRFSFDRISGELWVADVGQGEREEVDRVLAGGNYGWRCFEGTRTFASDCGPNAGSSLPPVAEYTHASGRSVTGGHVYRGAAFPVLQGRYVFGDFASGRLWHFAADQAPTLLLTAGDGDATGLAIASFAESAAGELYVVDYGGFLHRVVPAD
jgi:glucose/arabinose dehydrogenase